ncbi:hypothetical protein RB596_001978 [Gaeumannomyces avenae]
MSFPAAAAVGFAACGALVAAAITLAICRFQPTKREPIDNEAQDVVPTEPRAVAPTEPQAVGPTQPQVVVPLILGHPGIRYISRSMNQPGPLLTHLAKNLKNGVRTLVESCCMSANEYKPVDISLSPIIAAAGDGEDWEELLNHPIGRYWGLQALVMRVIARWMDPESGPDHTLIPPDLLRLYQTSIAKPVKDPKLQAALAAWPKITYNLMSEAAPRFWLTTRHEFADGDSRLPNVLKLEELLAQLLEPFGPGVEDLDELCRKNGVDEEFRKRALGNTRSQHGPYYLREVTMAAANLALPCFAHGDAIAEFRFPPGRASSAPDRRIMVSPAIRYRRATAPAADSTAPNAGETAGAREPGDSVRWREIVPANFSLWGLTGLWYFSPREDSDADHKREAAGQSSWVQV